MLFEMTSTFICWASMPVEAISMERMFFSLLGRRLLRGDAAELVDG
jgi:hypothetical protein